MIGINSAIGRTAAYATAGELDAVISSTKNSVVELPIAPATHPLKAMKFIRSTSRAQTGDDEDGHDGDDRSPQQ